MKTPAEIGWRMQVELGHRGRHFAWLKARRGRMTGSKIADIMGHGYNSVHDRYLIERGELEVDGKALAIRRGQLMEPEILRAACADPFRPGYFELLETPRFVVMPGDEWAGCSPDFLAVSSSPAYCEMQDKWPVRIFGEIKSRDSRAAVYYKNDQIKASDEYQIRWGCLVTGAHVGIGVVHLGSADGPEYRTVIRDPVIDREMMQAAKTFLEAVKTGDLGILQTLADKGDVRREIARSKWEATRADVLEIDDPAVADLIAKLERLKGSRVALTDEIKATEAEIVDIMGPHEVLRAGRWRVRLPGSQKARRTFSRTMLATALPHIDLEPYYTVSEPSPRGRMTIKELEDDEI